jgi:hypothetical protein
MKIVIVAALVFIVIAVSWLQTQFGANTALMVLGGTLGIICFSGGALLAYGISRATLNAASDFNHDLAGTERYRQMTGREHARGEREAFNARAKLDVIEAKRVDRIAQQRAGLLVDLERQRWEGQQKQIPQWATDDDNGGTFQEWE